MNNKSKIYRYRSRKNDDQLHSWDERTYQGEHNILFLLVSIFCLFVFNFLHQKFLGASLFQLLHAWRTPDDLHSLEVAKVKLGTLLALSFSIGLWASYKLTKPISYSHVSPKSEHFYYSDTIVATQKLHEAQREKGEIINFKSPKFNSWTLVSPMECKGKTKLYQPIQFNSNASILGAFLLGLAGSGKSVLLDRIYQNILKNGHKLIVHAPDSNARDKIVSSGYSCVISAPWLKSSVFIDLASTLNVDDANLKNELIGLVITSFFGYVDPSSNDAFFQNGAVYILTASLRKLCHTKPGQWTLEDWLEELVTKNQIWQFKDLVDTYYPEASFTISEDAEKMTASIIASITQTLVSIGRLSLYYKNCRKPFDLRKWCLDEDDKQCIVLCSDTEYAEASKINIALFVNLTIPFMLSSSREKVFKANGKRIYQALDEFPTFARNIDLNSWIRIINEGRKFGNSAFVACQVIKQFISCFTTKNPTQDAQKFIGSFHSQYIAQPSNEDEEFLQSIVGEVTYDEKEAQATIDQTTGKKSISYPNKQRKEKINFKTMQNDLGVVKNKAGEPIGVKVAVRLFETTLTAPLFFPFVQEFAKENRDRFREKIVVLKGKEYIKHRKSYSPLFVKVDKIIFTKDDESRIYNLNALASKTARLEVFTKSGKLKEAQELMSEIIGLKNSLGFEMNEKEAKFQEENKDEGLIEKTIGDSFKDTALEAIDHTGTLSAISNASEMLEALSDNTTENQSAPVSSPLVQEAPIGKLKLKKLSDLER